MSHVKLSLKKQMILLSLLLTTIPLIITGFLSVRWFSQFGETVAGRSYDALKEQTVTGLEKACELNREIVAGFIKAREDDAVKFACSENLIGYLSTAEGRNPIFNEFLREEISRVIEGIQQTCRTQQEILQTKLASNLSVAGFLLKEKGQISFSSKMIPWQAVNQFTQDKTEISLPVMQAGTTELIPNKSFSVSSPVVDEATELVGGACTLFQRMNNQGDMLRIVTNVKKPDGQRAIGTFIPAINADGKPNPVVASVLNGKTYYGRAAVVGQWYLTAYKPLPDSGGKIIGMLFTGIPDQASEALVEKIKNIKVGKSGFVLVLDSKGKVKVHTKSHLMGKNIVSDLNQDSFKKVLADREEGKVQIRTYLNGTRNEFIAYTYFPDWDWILCVIGGWDEMTQKVAQMTRRLLEEEIRTMYFVNQLGVKDQKFPIYSQIRFVTPEGQELISLVEGKILPTLNTKWQEEWFQECLKLPAGKIYNSGVIISPNTGKPELRIAVPVVLENRRKGLVVLNANWDLVWKIVGKNVYGKTGYSYIVNDNGVLVSHPKYSLKDHVNLTDVKFGELASIVSNTMLKTDKTGHAQYTFEGIDKFVGYSPLNIGDKKYIQAVTGPVKENIGLAEEIHYETQARTRQITRTIIGITFGIIGTGCLFGLFVSLRIIRLLAQIILNLTGEADELAGASGQVSTVSHSIAQGATDQAASLEESSSALEQMAAVSKTNAENAAKANDLVKETDQVLGESKNAMQQSSSAMDKINEAGSKIANIIKVIEEIAFQTNLLALNAAVEAARAGDHGKGFAVVADEVRNLAQRSAKAANETSGLIGETIERLKKGTEVNAGLAVSFQKVSETSLKIVHLVDEIASASTEQAKGINQVNASISRIDKIVQQGAANAEEASASAEQLSAQAKSLKENAQLLEVLVWGRNSTKTPSATQAKTPGGKTGEEMER